MVTIYMYYYVHVSDSIWTTCIIASPPHSNGLLKRALCQLGQHGVRSHHHGVLQFYSVNDLIKMSIPYFTADDRP